MTSFTPKFLNTSVRVETTDRETKFTESNIHSIVRQICTLPSKLIKQLIFKFQILFYVIFDREVCDVKDVRETNCGYICYTFVHWKKANNHTRRPRYTR